MIGKKLGDLIFKARGWQCSVDPTVISDPKQVVIGFPHTSNQDTILAVALFLTLNKHFHLLVKKELFVFPLSILFKKIGFIPVDRKSSKNIVKTMAERFNDADEYTLLIAPEASRNKDGEHKPIRTGFWHIAKAANVPIVLMLADNATKTGRLFGKVYPTDDMYADLKNIKAHYAQYGINMIIPEQKPVI